MEHYQDFSLDSCMVDGVSIAESLLYKDAEELRVQEFSTDSSASCMDPKSNIYNASLAPVNAVAAAAFGSAYSRTASGGLEEVLITNDDRLTDNDVSLHQEQDVSSNRVTLPFGGGNNSGSACDNSYSKWNELVNKLVDSQEDIPSLSLDSGNVRGSHATKTHEVATASAMMKLPINQLGDFGPIACAGKSTNGRSPSSSSTGSSNITTVGDGSVMDHSLNRAHGIGSSSRLLPTSTSATDYTGHQHSPFHGIGNDANWLSSAELDICGPGSVMSDQIVGQSNPNGLNFERHDNNWSNTYPHGNCISDAGSVRLQRGHADPSHLTAMGVKCSSGITSMSRLRPIVGKCSDDLFTVTQSCSTNPTNMPSMNSLQNQAGTSHMLPLLRNNTPEMFDSGANVRTTSEASTVSSLMAAAVGSYSFNGGNSSNLGIMNSNLSSATTPVFHLTADSLRLASRSQLNPNAEKFVFVPPNSTSSANTVLQHQQVPQQQHHFHHGHHTQHQQHHHQQPLQQQHCVSGTPYFSVQAKHNYVSSSTLSQANLTVGTSATNGATYTTSCSSSNLGGMNSCSVSAAGINGGGTASSSCMSSGPSPLSHHLLSLNTISPVTFNFQTKFNILAEQRKSLDRERNRIEAELCRQYPGKRITSGVCGASLPPAVKSCNSSDRVDRELNTVLGNHARVVALIAKMEKLQNGGDPLPSHVHSTMECWLEGIRKCQARRKEELVNMTNRQRSGPRQQDEKDVIALTLALAELTEHMRRARTALWAALQMTHKDRASSARDAFRFLDHVRRHGLMVVAPPQHLMANTNLTRAIGLPLNTNSISSGSSSSSGNSACGDNMANSTSSSVAASIVTTAHSLLSVQ